MNQKYVILLLCLISFFFSRNQECWANNIKDSSAFKVSLRQALDSGNLKLMITGSYDPRLYIENIDRDGLHYGKCMMLIVQSNLDSFAVVKLNCGTLLVPIDDSVQTMIVTNDVDLPLYPQRGYATRIYAMCAQFHDNPPSIATEFKLGETADSNLFKLAGYIQSHYVQNMIGQHAIWAVTDNVKYRDLANYGADSISIRETRHILKELNIKTAITSEEPVEIKSDSLFIISRLYVYVGLVLIVILTLIVIALALNRKRVSGISS